MSLRQTSADGYAIRSGYGKRQQIEEQQYREVVRYRHSCNAQSCIYGVVFFFSRRRRHTRCSRDWEFRRVLFRSGVVCYSNDLKTAWVNVPAELIQSKGAVSSEVAMALADGIRRSVGSTLGVGITGIAGPGGGKIGRASCRERG